MFDFLDQSGETWNTGKPGAPFVGNYIEKIDFLFDVLNEAGVANLDARAANIMWRAVNSSEVEIRMIDIEDTFRFGDILSTAYANALNNDDRYPIIAEGDRAMREHNEFFRTAIKYWASSSEASFGKYVSANRNTIIAESSQPVMVNVEASCSKRQRTT